jgi:uncharacterized membrane protein YdjX (TVP38/TMEM64 family)
MVVRTYRPDGGATARRCLEGICVPVAAADATVEIPSPSMPEPSARGKARYIVAAVLIAAAVAAAVAFLPVKDVLIGILDWTRAMGLGGAAVFVLVYAAACVLFLPGSLLTLGAGFAFGLVGGTLAAIAGSLLGCSAAFLLGRTVLRRWVESRSRAHPRFRALDEAVGKEGFKIVLLSRLSPVFPFNLLNYAFGVTRVGFRDYFLASWIGMFPGTLLYVYLGAAAKDLTALAAGRIEGGTARHVLLAVGLAATVAVTLLITRIARRTLKGTIAPDGPARSTPAGKEASHA